VPAQHLDLDRLLQAAKLPAVAAVALTLAVTASASANDAADRAEAETASAVVQPHREARFDPVQPQVIEPSTTLVAVKDKNRKVRIDSPRGGHVFTASQLASHDLPQAALAAYQDAAATLASTDPGCHLPWTLLAAIGRVESDHGRYGGSVLATDGVSRPEIIGVALNGKGPVAAIRDTDGGRLDGDDTWDRAVGPMQFIPSTWAWSGRDGDGDGRLDPHDLDDAALAAGDYLCSGADLRDSDAMDAAILRYNPSDYYVALVRAFEVGYRTGVFVIPSPDAPADDDQAPRRKKRDTSRDDRGDRGDRGDRDGGDRPKRGDRPRSDPDPSPTPKPSPKPRPKADPAPAPKPAPAPATQPAPQPGTPAPQPSEPSKPAPSPTPTPSPSPSPTVETFTGTLGTCADGWCLAGERLDLGPETALTQPAAEDYDGDGTVEDLGVELDGLATGGTVTVRAVRTDGGLVVRELAGKPFPR
jgi:membrane-bound lytic murein transglycosylase B